MIATATLLSQLRKYRPGGTMPLDVNRAPNGSNSSVNDATQPPNGNPASGDTSSPLPPPGFNQDPYNLSSDPLKGGGQYGEGRISDAVSRLDKLQSALKSGEIDYTTYNKLFQQFDPAALDVYHQLAGGGSNSATAAEVNGGSKLAQMSNAGGMDLNTFSSQLKNLTGRDPNAQDINNYFSNLSPMLGNNTSYADMNSMVNQYLQNTYQPDIQKYQQQQQMGAFNTGLQQVQDLVNQQNKAAVSNLTSPQTMEAYKMSMNNGGMLDSGAFSTGLASNLANAANNNVSAGLGSFGLPAIGNMYGTQNQPYQNFLQNLNTNTQTAGSNQNSFNEWNMNKDLAEKMAGGQQQSGIQQWMPLISSLIGAGGSIGAAMV